MVKTLSCCMVFTQHVCARCGSEHIRRNGSSQGHAKYQCKACGHQARFEPAAAAKAVQYAQVEQLLVARHSQRSIERATGVARMTIARLLKKSGRRPAPAPEATAEKGGAHALAGAGTG